LSLYFLTTLKLSPGISGALILVTSISFRFNRVFLAPVIDRLPPRVAVCAGLWVGAAGYAGLAVTRNPLIVTALLLVVGVGGATNTLSVKTMAAGRSPGSKSPLVRYATLSTGLNLAAATGPLVASVIYPGDSAGWVFAIAAVCYALAACLVVLIPASAHDTKARPAWRKTSREVLSIRDFRQVLILTALGFFLYSQLYTTLPFFATEALHVPRLRGSFFTLNAILVICAQIRIGQLLQRRSWPEHYVAYAGCGLFTLGFALLWAVPRWWMAYVAVALWTFGEMLIMPPLDAMTARVLEPGQRIIGFSFAGVAMSVGDGIGGALGVALAGWLASRGDLNQLYGLIALGSLLALAGVAAGQSRGRRAVHDKNSRHHGSSR